MNFYKLIKRGYEDVLNIFYPRLCFTCQNLLLSSEDIICHNCLSQLAFTHFDFKSGNPVHQRLSTIVPVEKATSLFLFDKAGVVQEMIHQLKYEGKQEIGKLIAEITGNFFDEKSLFSGFDYIIPVPLHPEKQKKRGYNQLTVFGENLGNYFGIKYSEQILIRTKNTPSQTKLSAGQRRENVAGAFDIHKPDEYRQKHFLLIDDVMTTGATLEACAETILQNIPNAKVSVLTIAVVL